MGRGACNFSNHTAMPSYTSSDYYERMFEGGGSSPFDFQRYWTDNSYGNLSAAGTKVTGWHTLGITRDAWGALDRDGKRQSCARQGGCRRLRLPGYYGFMVLFPEAKTTLASSIDGSQTTITVASTNSTDIDRFPATPFRMSICASADCQGMVEVVNVTAINDTTTFTVQRNQAGTLRHRPGRRERSSPLTRRPVRRITSSLDHRRQELHPRGRGAPLGCEHGGSRARVRSRLRLGRRRGSTRASSRPRPRSTATATTS